MYHKTTQRKKGNDKKSYRLKTDRNNKDKTSRKTFEKNKLQLKKGNVKLFIKTSSRFMKLVRTEVYIKTLSHAFKRLNYFLIQRKQKYVLLKMRKLQKIKK